ncbi:MAG TPA: metallophosphoesterase [Arenibaculum sp.]|nr:metallophosphoesterase [Arenibaculum sp.]
MAERWNATVGRDDEVWHLGDFCVSRDARMPGEILARLHGRKHLITGNNDPPETTVLSGWTSIRTYAEFELDGTRLVLCHYPFRTWNGMGKGALNLHGHSHGRLKPVPRQVDVGVDVWDFRPVTLDEIRAGLARRGRRTGSRAAAPDEARARD